jgi:mono/diheme cytochrome c family protein
VPELGNILIAPGVEDGVELYDIACASCHGASGEGLFGLALSDSGISDITIRAMTLFGRERSGMPGFEGQFTDEQLEALVAYTAGIASGEIEPAPVTYPLPPGKLECADNPDTERCGGN